MSGYSKNAGAGADEGDEWFRPVWDGDDEDADAAPPWAFPDTTTKLSSAAAGQGWQSDPHALAALLGPALAASDALARLDARAGAASEQVREGLVRRLALHEAAGWLAAQGAWVHPLDLALRAQGLAGPFGLAAAVGRAGAEMPNTLATSAGTGWQARTDAGVTSGEQPFGAAQVDDAVGRALGLARALERLGLLCTRDPLRSDPALVEALAALGAGPPDPARAAAWRRNALAGIDVRRPSRNGAGASLPPLLAAAWAAQAWSEGGGGAAQALFGAAALMSRAGALQAVPLPFWAAYPALGRGGGPSEELPKTQANASAQEADGVGAAWPLAFCRLAREAALAGLRELGRLETAAERGRAATADLDRRSRLPDVLDAVLRTPALTPTLLARRLHIAPQTATALLRTLLAAGLMREVTGRKHFRAFAA